jgi:hypothetical protein
VAAWLACLCIAAPGGHAQDAEFRAEVDRETIALDDSLTLTLRLSGQLGRVPALDLGEVPDFEVFSRGQSQRMSVVNGRMSVESIQQFELRPRRVGPLQIPSFSVEVDGQSLSTQPLSISVTEVPKPPEAPGSSAGGQETPAGSGEVELLAAVAPEQVYVGQQITYRLRIFRRVQWSEPGLDNVKFDGFWVEDLGGSGTERRLSHNGQVYLHQDLRYALFPSAPGTHELEPRTLRYSRLTGNDFFFAMTQPAPPVRSNAVRVRVLPIPEQGRPPEYGGAVGSLQVSAQLDRDQTRQDQAVTLTLVVSGIGNPHTFPQPPLHLPEDVEAFETQSDVYVNKKRDLVSGSHTFKTVLVPRAPGEFELGPFELWTFDPYQKRFAQVRSQPLVLKVEKGKEAPAPGTASEATRREELRLLGEDIRYLKPIEPGLQPYSGPLATRLVFWLAVGLPIGALGGLAAFRRHRDRLSTDVGFRRRRHALRIAQERLAVAGRSSEGSEVCRLSEAALVGFLSDWFNLAASVEHQALQQRLRQAGVSAPLVESLGRFLSECGFLRFSSSVESDGARDRLVQRARELLGELQREVATR